MRWRVLIVVGLYWQSAGYAATLELSVGDVAGPGWQAQGLSVQLDPQGAARLQVQRVVLTGSGAEVVSALELSCPQAQWLVAPLRCDKAHFSARLPQIGSVSGTVLAAYRDASDWSLAAARVDTPLGPFALDLRTSPQGLQGRVNAAGLNLARLGKTLPAWGLRSAFTTAGRADLDLQLLLRGDHSVSAQYRIKLSALTLSETSGRYASDKLAASIEGTARADRESMRAQASFALPGGQLYWEPMFGDFGVHPLHGEIDLAWAAKAHRFDLARLSFVHAGVAEGELYGTLDPAQPAATARLELESLNAHFPGFFEVYLKPLLAGKAYEDLQTAGGATLHAAIEQGKPVRLDLGLQDLGLDSAHLNAGLAGIDGRIVWDAGGAAAESAIRWREGHFGKLPLAASGLQFRAGARDVALSAAFRQPLLDGALRIDRLGLQNLGTPQLEAQFDARLEPMSLDQLCRALDWPVFRGQLSGALSGLRLHAGVLAVDGALTAQAFDGAIAVTGLRMTDPLGPLPQLSADLSMRSLDLAALTDAFSFGRIEGRLDVDVDALRLLAWRPTAFKARIYTPSDDRSRHRISQRAVDNISAIGGGPSGLLSRGFMSLFKNFDYERIGMGCELAKDVCRMDGIEPAPGGGYYLVKGRWLPRIDVIGYAREVNWDALVQQVDEVRHAQKAEVR